MTELIQKALDDIEENLNRKLDIRDIAKRAYLSPYYFQRLFSAVCGVGAGEYIRCRRLSLAGEELSRTNSRVIDIAAKYGYDSPDSFARAFQRFHGITPSAARKEGVALRSYPPVRIRKTTEVSMMEYRIEEKQSFAVVGVSRRFHPDTSYQQIPAYWTEMLEQPGFPILGMYGICMDGENTNSEFDYWIADPYTSGQKIPDGCRTLEIPGGTWAVFPCRLKTLQDTNTKMWKEWLPNCPEYRLRSNCNIEFYFPVCEEDPGESAVELWLPVERKCK